MNYQKNILKLKNEFDSEPVYNEKYLKPKRKSYNGKINTHCHNNKIAKEGSQLICLSVILIDSIFRTGKNFYPQMFLEKFKYIVKENKMPEYMIDNILLKFFLVLIEKILMKKILIKKNLMKKVKYKISFYNFFSTYKK